MLFNERCYNESAYNSKRESVPYEIVTDTIQRIFVQRRASADVKIFIKTQRDIFADSWQSVFIIGSVFADTEQLAIRMRSIDVDTTQIAHFQRSNFFDTTYEARALIRPPENSFLFGSNVYNYKVYNQRSWGINKKFLADTEQKIYLPRTFQSDIQLAVRSLTEVAADATQRVFFERLTSFNVLVKSWMPIDIGADAKYEARALIRPPENSFLFGSNVYNYKVYNQRSWGINKKFLADTEQKIYLLKRTDIDTIQVSYCKRQYFADTQQALKLLRLIAADFKLVSYLKTQSRFDTEINIVFFTYKKGPYQGARLAPDKVSARLKRSSVRVKNISPAVYIKRRDSNK